MMCFKPISVQSRGEPFHPTLLLQGGGTGTASKNAALGFLALHIVLAALSKTCQDMMPQNIYVSTSEKEGQHLSVNWGLTVWFTCSSMW